MNAWSLIEGLQSHSGGARYSTVFEMPGSAEGTPVGPVTLDLGRVVSSAEVTLNGTPLGVRVAPPWTFDLSPALRPGLNSLEVLVYNTLANHYTTIPTRYRGSLESGLIGPVMLLAAHH